MDNDSVNLFRKYFKGREDDFAEQTLNGYTRVGRPLEDNDIFLHLKGDRSYGVYLIEPKNNTVFHTVIDIDCLDVSFVQKILNSAIKLGIKEKQLLKEFSGNKGYHIWFIYNEPIETEKARRLGQIIIAQSVIERNIEVFPKQDKVSENGFGNLIKLPFGIHKKSGQRSYILDNNLNPVPVWEDYLISFTKIDIEQVDNILKEFDYILPKPTIAQGNSETKSLSCFKRIMEFGVAEGQRDNIAFRLAIYLKNQGLTADLALSALNDWNGNNRPPLKVSVIANKIKSVFEHNYSGYGCEQDYMKEFCNPDCPIKNMEVLKKETLPVSLTEFLKKDIPPLEYYVLDLLLKKGKGMISAHANIGKSILSQNLALALASGKDIFLNKFSISPARVLYLDLEMGESALRERFQKMCAKEALNCDNLFVMYKPSTNLLNGDDRKELEYWLTELKIEVLIIDPLGNAWIGNENEQEQVSQLTVYLNDLIYKYGISQLIVHHWRKSTKDFRSGGQMAAGSYKWEAWLDCHITLEGNPQSITISSQKNRNRPRFKSFVAKINEETLWFEFLADYERKYDESTLITLFDSFGLERVAIPALIKKAEDQNPKICSEATIRKLLKETTLFEINKTGKTHYLIKKGGKKDLLDGLS